MTESETRANLAQRIEDYRTIQVPLMMHDREVKRRRGRRVGDE